MSFQFLSREKLETLNTKRLLAYKRKVVMNVPASSCGIVGCDCMSDIIMSRSDPEWQRVYSDLKEILATREHIER